MKNAFYVTVSIPLLLVLAGFNHAHGLTTFGQSKTQGTQQQQKPTAQGKSCTIQENCDLLTNTTCVNNQCLCGNNQPPENAKCSSPYQGAHHLCTNNEQCTENAICLPAKDTDRTGFKPDQKICVCQNELQPTQTGTCGGESVYSMLPTLAIIIISLSTTLN